MNNKKILDELKNEYLDKAETINLSIKDNFCKINAGLCLPEITTEWVKQFIDSNMPTNDASNWWNLSYLFNFLINRAKTKSIALFTIICNTEKPLGAYCWTVETLCNYMISGNIFFNRSVFMHLCIEHIDLEGFLLHLPELVKNLHKYKKNVEFILGLADLLCYLVDQGRLICIPADFAANIIVKDYFRERYFQYLSKCNIVLPIEDKYKFPNVTGPIVIKDEHSAAINQLLTRGFCPAEDIAQVLKELLNGVIARNFMKKEILSFGHIYGFLYNDNMAQLFTDDEKSIIAKIVKPHDITREIEGIEEIGATGLINTMYMPKIRTFGSEFTPISRYNDVSAILEKYSGIEFVVFPSDTLRGNYHTYNIEPISVFKARNYWKFFEEENMGSPRSDSFTQDPKNKNVYYPTNWEIFEGVMKNKKMAARM